MSLLHVYRRSTEGFLQPSASPSSLFGGDLDLIRSPSIISAPASPTAALEEEQGQWETTITRPSYSKQRRSSSSHSRRVTFDSEAKLHDGLTSRNEILDSMIKRYFCHQKEVSELDVIDMCKRSIPSIKELHEDLQDILARVEEVAREGRPSVPVLPRGGGMCTKLGAVHVPYIKILDKVVEASAVRLARTQ